MGRKKEGMLACLPNTEGQALKWNERKIGITIKQGNRIGNELTSGNIIVL